MYELDRADLVMTRNREIRCHPGQRGSGGRFVYSFDRDTQGEWAPEGGQQVQGVLPADILAVHQWMCTVLLALYRRGWKGT